MAQIDARADRRQSPTPGRFQRIGSMIGAWLDRLLSPSVVAVGFVIMSFFIIRTGFEMHRYYQSLEVETIANESDDLWQQIYSNLGIEILSIAITVIVIERLNRREAERERKEDLIFQLRSPINGVAVEAVRRLQQKEWGFKEDKSLQGANLFEANLQGANLSEANLRGANLSEANLQGADLGMANLQGANLCMANLRDAKLSHFLSGRAKFDETTILPDRTKWTPNRDLRQFTDPNGWRAGRYKTNPTADS